MTISKELAALYARDLKRVAEELAAFPDDETIWKTVPGISNPAGNLALHLEGNLREFVGRQLGGVAYKRERPKEFSTKGLTRAELVARVDSTRELIVPVVGKLTLEKMAAEYPENVLGKELSTRQFLVHLLGHLNYHLGQMDYARRLLTGKGAIPLAGL